MNQLPLNESPAYLAARNGAAVGIVEDAGYIRIGGPDRIDFLQRQSTNDLRVLASDRIVETVLTTPAARIRDVLTVIDEGEQLGLITVPGRAARTAAFLRSQIFFMDKVTVADHSVDVAQLLLAGPLSASVMYKVAAMTLPEDGRIVSAAIGGEPVHILASPAAPGEYWVLIAARMAAPHIVEVLQRAGMGALSSADMEILRIERGMPGAFELSEEYTPFEVGLERAVSASKGCYTGQEVLARQATYDKVTRQLAGIRPDGPVGSGDPVFVGGSRVGQITSAGSSPGCGQIALAVIRRPHDAPGGEVRIGESRVGGAVCDLPFTCAQ